MGKVSFSALVLSMPLLWFCFFFFPVCTCVCTNILYWVLYLFRDFFSHSDTFSLLETLQCGTLKEGLFSCLLRLSDTLFAHKV